MIVVLIEPLADDLAIGSPPLPVNGRYQELFRNKCRHISLKAREANHDDRSRSLCRGRARRARKYSGRSQSYLNGSDEHALWAAGHEKVAGAIEARKSEGR
ncbi:MULTISPECIES: hypothetical protein [unclassified Bradyrhizobium]|jgi:hypothetical protein|uniref:hypothetical protein n=1 Tax=unclassified Bradyrhizobium TaxID=2631580 RepID=UPI001404B331|nr:MULTISPECIES: hypothetical protein [unclassified Bradyrhizobium]